MPTEINEGDSATTETQGVLIHGVTAVPGVIKAVRLTTDGELVTGGSMAPANYDQLLIGYSGADISSVIYYQSGTTVGTLALAYDGSSQLTSVVRT